MRDRIIFPRQERISPDGGGERKKERGAERREASIKSGFAALTKSTFAEMYSLNGTGNIRE